MPGTIWLLIVILAVGEGGMQLGPPHASKSDCMNALLVVQELMSKPIYMTCVRA